MEAAGNSLKDCDIEINYGIKTGYNDAFFISEDAYQKIIKDDQNAQKLIRPLLRGRDISAFHTPPSGQYLIGTFPTLNLAIDDYPAIKEHLLTFDIRRLEQSGKKYPLAPGKTLSARKKTSFAWFETQDSIGYWQDFLTPKIVYPNMTTRFPFSYDESSSFSNDKTFILSSQSKSNLLLLVAILNSRMAKLWIWHHCPELNGGAREIRKVYFEEFPVPSLSETEKAQMIALSSEIISKKKSDADISTEVEAIEVLLSEHYSLTVEERKALDNFEAMLNNMKGDTDEETQPEQPAPAKPITKKEVKRVLPETEDDYLD